MNALTREMGAEEHAHHLSHLDIYGYARVKDWLLPNTLHHLKDIVAQLWNAHRENRYHGLPVHAAGARLLFNLQNRDKLFIDLLVEPTLKKLMMAKLNDPYYDALPREAPNYILGYYNARSSEGALRLHIDSYIPAPGDLTWAVQAAIILDDQTEENGCTTIVPGSHRIGRYTDRLFADVKPLPSRAGDLVLWDSRLWHGALANKTGGMRWSLIATFHMWWLKQKMDIPRALPEEIYRQLTDEQKQLLGYCTLPPRDESLGIQTKRGYEALKPSVQDYFAV